jgi:hypothetical protein
MKTFRKNYLFTIASISLGLTLSACGGGGGGSSSTSSSKAEGAYSGSITNSSSNAFQLLVLENDEYLGLYGTSTGNAMYVAGFIQGTGRSNNGVFSSSNAKDFGINPPVTASINANYVEKTSIQGSVSASGQSTTFSGTAIPSTTYNYNTAADINTITGSWYLTSLDGSPTSLSIATNGSFSGSSYGCSFNGTLAPRSSGKNVFNFTLTFGAAPCALPGQSGSGIAISNLLPGTTSRQLIMAGTDSTRSAGTVLFGTR